MKPLVVEEKHLKRRGACADWRRQAPIKLTVSDVKRAINGVVKDLMAQSPMGPYSRSREDIFETVCRQAITFMCEVIPLPHDFRWSFDHQINRREFTSVRTFVEGCLSKNDRHIYAIMQLAAWMIPTKRKALKMDWPGKERYETRIGIWHKKCPCGAGFLAGSTCRNCEGAGRIRT